MTDAPHDAPAPKPGILDIAPYVGGKSRIEGVAEPMKLSSNENALGAGEKAREAFAGGGRATSTCTPTAGRQSCAPPSPSITGWSPSG